MNSLAITDDDPRINGFPSETEMSDFSRIPVTDPEKPWDMKHQQIDYGRVSHRSVETVITDIDKENLRTDRRVRVDSELVKNGLTRAVLSGDRGVTYSVWVWGIPFPQQIIPNNRNPAGVSMMRVSPRRRVSMRMDNPSKFQYNLRYTPPH